MDNGAQFSPDRIYRYALWRTWETGNGHILFIGLNPSTADETKDDPTIRRCIGFAKNLGYGGIYMLNIFAYRATNPKVLRKAEKPVGEKNNHFLQMYFDPIGFNIACWGMWGEYLNRGREVINMLGEAGLHCFGLTKNGQPRHPLYLRTNAELLEMQMFQQLPK